MTQWSFGDPVQCRGSFFGRGIRMQYNKNAQNSNGQCMYVYMLWNIHDYYKLHSKSCNTGYGPVIV